MNKIGSRSVEKNEKKVLGGARGDRWRVSEKWKRGRIREMDEVSRRGSDERGLYRSGAGEAKR